MNTNYHLGLLFLRISFSGMMLVHGVPKLLQLLEGNLQFGDPIGIGMTLTFILAIIAEVVCPLLIIIGYKTRWATLPVIITMAVAAFVVHSADPFGMKELALLYLFAFITIGLLGAGKYAVEK